MTAEFPLIAAQNGVLLRVIAAGPCNNLNHLANSAEVRVDNLNRKLKALEDADLIHKVGTASHQVAITEAGRRALAALEAWTSGAPVAGADLELDPDLIDDNPFQPRTVEDEAEDLELARSIGDKGLLQPILVRPHPTLPGRFQNALGHRRKRAVRLAKANGWLPAEAGVPAKVRDLTDTQMDEIVVVENEQRSNLHWLDRGSAFMGLQDRHGYSAAQIERLVGQKGLKKRNIQELIKVARELPDEDRARAKLPDTNPDRLSYDDARRLIGNRKAKPALELSERQACALAELLDAGEAGEDQDGPVSVRLFCPPKSRDLLALKDKDLVRFRFAGSTPIAEVPPNVDLAKWLTDVGFHEDRETCLAKLRAAVVGEMVAGSLAVDNRYVLPELNYQDPEAPPASPPPPPAPTANSAQLDLEERLAPTPQPIILTPTQALAVMELAHKLGDEGQAITTPSGRAVPVGDYFRDPLHQDLVLAKLVRFLPLTDGGQGAMLGPQGDAWLTQKNTPRDEDGLPQVGHEALMYAQVASGITPGGRHRTYLTDWLNPREPEAATEIVVPEGGDLAGEHLEHELVANTGEAEAEMPAYLRRLAGGGVTTAEPKPAPDPLPALKRLAAAGRHVEGLLTTARSTKLKPEAVNDALTLLGDALAAADAVLSTEARHAEA